MALRIRELTDEEREEINRLAHARTAPARVVERARMVWWASQGQRVAAIAAELRLHPETVRLWLKRFNTAGLEGLQDAPRSGRPATYTPEQVGEIIATALTTPQHLSLPFGCWTLDRLEAYLNAEKGIPLKRSRIDELLSAEGLSWRSQETWFGERASVDPGPDEQTVPAPTKKERKEREVDPDFAQKRGPSRPCIGLPRPAVYPSAWTRGGPKRPRASQGSRWCGRVRTPPTGAPPSAPAKRAIMAAGAAATSSARSSPPTAKP